MPREKSVVAPRSACPACGHQIRWYDNIPVLSWIVLRGRCRDCKVIISPRYALVELLVATIFLACYWQFGLTLVTFKYCVFSFLIIGLVFTDAETRLLPDLLTLPGIFFGFVFSLFVPIHDIVAEILPYFWHHSTGGWRFHSFLDALFGAIIGSAFIYSSGLIYKLVRGIEGMGLGDVKLMAMVGAFVGFKLTLFTIFTASVIGAVFGLLSIPVVLIKRTRRRMVRGHETRSVAIKRAWESAKSVYRYYAMPFGVFLGTMALVAVFFGNRIYQWYFGRFL